jgi:hypothetical protein
VGLETADVFAGDLLQWFRQVDLEAEVAGNRRARRARIRIGHQEQGWRGRDGRVERLYLAAANPLTEADALVRWKDIDRAAEGKFVTRSIEEMDNDAGQAHTAAEFGGIGSRVDVGLDHAAGGTAGDQPLGNDLCIVAASSSATRKSGCGGEADDKRSIREHGFVLPA